MHGDGCPWPPPDSIKGLSNDPDLAVRAQQSVAMRFLGSI
jgi:hypothetical protein